MKFTRVHELDGVRGLAILLVIGCHYSAFASMFWGLPKFGWVGVDIFFVLSGYLITTVLLRLKGTDQALETFYRRRILRIVPPCFIAVVATYTLCALLRDFKLFELWRLPWFLLFLQSFQGLGDLVHAIKSGSPWVTTQLLPPAANGFQGSASDTVGILWSLSIEEYFYLLWAPVVLWCSRRTVVLVAAVICMVEFATRWVGFTGASNYFSIFYRFDALIYGALVALALQKRLLPKFLWSVLFVCTIGLGSVFVALGMPVGLEVRNSRLFMAVGLSLISLIVGACVGLLVLHTGSATVTCRFFRSAPMRSLGNISYMLYLIHLAIYLALVRVFGSEGMAVALSAFSLAAWMSWLSWKHIEHPLLSKRELNIVSETSSTSVASLRWRLSGR